MTREEMIAMIDGEIDRLEQVRSLLQKSTSNKFSSPSAAAPKAAPAAAKRVLSPEARKRIAQAQKRRWAKQRRETAG